MFSHKTLIRVGRISEKIAYFSLLSRNGQVPSSRHLSKGARVHI